MELSKEAAPRNASSKAAEVERGVEALALTEAPEIARKNVVVFELLLSFVSEGRSGSGLM